jgi:hypothetical protein
MRAAVVDRVAAWLQHPTHGVAALLPTTPVLSGARTPPALVGILASTVDEGAALGMVVDGQAVPVLVVSPNDEPVVMNNPAVIAGPRDYVVPVIVRYATRIGENEAAPDTAVAECDTDTTLRAVVRSLIRLCRVGTESDRIAAAVAVWSLESLSIASLWEAKGDTAVTGGVAARFRVRDSFVE